MCGAEIELQEIRIKLNEALRELWKDIQIIKLKTRFLHMCSLS